MVLQKKEIFMWKTVTIKKENKRTLFDLTTAIENELSKLSDAGYQIHSIQELQLNPGSHMVICIYGFKKPV